jgi:serine protease Do
VIEEEPAAEAEAPETAASGTEDAATETASRPAENGWYESAGYRPEEKPPVYADAHFEPADSTTVPPRYYTPPVRQEKEKKAKPAAKRQLGLRGAVALSLVCALLGGCLGAGISTLSANKRFEALETALEENSQADAETAAALADAEQRQNSLTSPVASAAGLMSPSQIYQLACSQVVGITTTVTTQSFFGTQTGTVSGSGFVLSEDGYILTNYHVVENADAGNLPITVVLYDGSKTAEKEADNAQSESDDSLQRH